MLHGELTWPRKYKPQKNIVRTETSIFFLRDISWLPHPPLHSNVVKQFRLLHSPCWLCALPISLFLNFLRSIFILVYLSVDVHVWVCVEVSCGCVRTFEHCWVFMHVSLCISVYMLLVWGCLRTFEESDRFIGAGIEGNYRLRRILGPKLRSSGRANNVVNCWASSLALSSLLLILWYISCFLCLCPPIHWILWVQGLGSHLYSSSI